MSTLYYYKNPKTLTNQGKHNLPQLWHSRIVKSSNLTFGEYVASTTGYFFDIISLLYVYFLKNGIKGK